MTHLAHFQKFSLAMAIAIAALCWSAWRADAAPYVQTDLVSDIPGLAAITEPELHNPWGLSHTGTSPIWTSNQGTSTANLFSITPALAVTKAAPQGTNGNITIPPGGAGAVGPTGQVANTNTASFLIPVSSGGDGNSAHFMFANLNGTISAWDAGQTAFTQVPATIVPGAAFTGLAINAAQTRLYAANDAGAGSINVFDASFNLVTTLPAGAFATPAAVSALNLVPFNVQDINGKVYVTYAPSGRPAQSGAAPGAGAVVVFDENGNFLQTLVLGSNLAAPWGLALAPAGFGEFANDLPVGNFSFMASEINAFDPTTGMLEGTIPVDPGAGNTPGGLWGLILGNGGSGGPANTLFFSDGINGEMDGLFAALTPNVTAAPEPSGLVILGTALALLGVRRLRSRRRA
jgi:uncharacterized protein (TIGR03118 family)